MHDTYKQHYLGQAERHIAIAEDRIARQKKIIDELVQEGQETDCALSMLHALETCLHAFEQHREMIFERCKNSVVSQRRALGHVGRLLSGWIDQLTVEPTIF